MKPQITNPADLVGKTIESYHFPEDGQTAFLTFTDGSFAAIATATCCEDPVIAFEAMPLAPRYLNTFMADLDAVVSLGIVGREEVIRP